MLSKTLNHLHVLELGPDSAQVHGKHKATLLQTSIEQYIATLNLQGRPHREERRRNPAATKKIESKPVHSNKHTNKINGLCTQTKETKL